MATMTSAATTRGVSERRFYSGMAIMMIAFMLIGFGPSFYLKDFVPSFPRPNPSLTAPIIAHGLLFTLWMLVFWAQTALVAVGRRDLHARLGVAGMILALLLVPLMYWIAVGQVARATQPPFTSALAWTAVPLMTIPAYLILIGLGWNKRRQAQAHKRLMLGAALLFMAPSVGRFPLAPPDLVGHFILQTLALATFLPLLWWDRRTLGRIHWASGLGLALAAVAVYVPFLLFGSEKWARLASLLPGV